MSLAASIFADDHLSDWFLGRNSLRNDGTRFAIRFCVILQTNSTPFISVKIHADTTKQTQAS